MPELPEVETTRRGLSEHLIGATITDVIIRNPKLRWPIPKNLPALLRGQKILTLTRRAKYLLADCGNGTLILHLGMSGSLRILPHNTPPEKHDHFDLVLNNGKLMRLRDPRRFGAVLWHEGDAITHPLLATLGPEPLAEICPPYIGVVGASHAACVVGAEAPYNHGVLPASAREIEKISHAGRAPTNAQTFDARYLYQATRGRSISIKQCIMDNHVVVGVGNIYANESLFRSGIKPQLAAGKLSLPRCEKLVTEIRATLRAAIAKGGSTLRDFVHSDGSSGYFQQEYFVYGRTGESCRKCSAMIKQIKQGQRSSFYCDTCQK